MTETTRWRSRRPSLSAVLAGFVATAGLSLGTDEVMHVSGVFPPWGQPMSDGLFVWATVYRVLYTVLGGYITARLAPRKPMEHALLLGALGMVVGTIGAVATWNQGPQFGPKWYPILIVVTALPSVWAGGKLFDVGTGESST